MSGILGFFASLANAAISLVADTVSASTTGAATSSWRLDADGGVYWARSNVSGGAFIKQYDWCVPNSAAGNYECTWDVGTGTVDTTPGAAGTWLALTTDRTWTETNAIGFEQATFTARIRPVAGGAETTALITLEVDGS